MGGGGGEASASAAASPNGKRGRDPEDEVYLDNFHSHKRYLSEVCISWPNLLLRLRLLLFLRKKKTYA